MTDTADTTTPMEPRSDHRRAPVWANRRVRFFVLAGVLLSFASALPVLWVRNLEVDECLMISERSAFAQAHSERAGVRLFTIDTESGPPASFVRDQSLDRWWMRTPKKRRPVWLAIEVAAGMPLPLVSGGFITVMNDQGQPVGEPWGVPIPSETLFVMVPESFVTQGFYFSDLETAPILPTRIIWRGLIGNTIFYALIVWGVFAMLGWARRAIRRRRGRCEGCGYSLDGLERTDRCPECGHAFMARRIEAPVS